MREAPSSIHRSCHVCNILISNLKLGLPSDEEEVFDKLSQKKVISKEMVLILKEMKGFRNILVHKYGVVKDEIVFENLSRLSDFTDFIEEILKYLKRKK